MRRAMLTAGAVLVPAFVAVGTPAAAGIIGKPAGVQNGDTVFCLVGRQDSAPVAPSGFDLVGTNSATDEDTFHFSTFRRTIDGSEGSTFAATGNIGVAVAYRNIATSAASSATSAAVGTTLTYPDITSAAGQAVIGFGFAYGSSAIATPAGHTERLDAATASYRFQVVDILPASGDIAAVGVTATGAQVTVAVRAAY